MNPDKNFIGYARVSTDDQDLSLQIDALVKFGIGHNHIIREYASGGTMNRPEWNRIVAAARRGQTIVVWRLDRIGRTTVGVLETVADLAERGIGIKSLSDPIDTTTPHGKLFLTFSVAMAEWERDMISVRTKAGMAVKRAEGVRFGPAHSIKDNPKRIAAYRELVEAGSDETMTANQILAVLNAADPKAKKIKSVNTLRNWRRAGCPGV